MKIGILTFYYGSENYGAVLQAYALNKFLSERFSNYNVETINYDMIRSNKSLLNSIIDDKKRRIKNLIKHRMDSNKMIVRFDEVRKGIPHSAYCNYLNISEIVQDYDILIAGSDQIWNPDFSNDINFFLPFDKKSISYAASIGKSELSDDEIFKIKKNLKNIDYISFREKKDELRFQPFFSKKIETVLDPTLLLNYDDWNDFVGDNSVSSKQYVLFYILGDLNSYIPLINKLAKHDHNVRLISSYYTDEEKKIIDKGHIEFVHCAGPKEFLGAIRDSDYIFTDSFHATVFSYIFRKQFVVFPKRGMNERVITLLDILNLQSRFCSIESMISKEIPDIDYNLLLNSFEQKKEESIRFLDNAIND